MPIIGNLEQGSISDANTGMGERERKIGGIVITNNANIVTAKKSKKTKKLKMKRTTTEKKERKCEGGEEKLNQGCEHWHGRYSCCEQVKEERRQERKWSKPANTFRKKKMRNWKESVKNQKSAGQRSPLLVILSYFIISMLLALAVILVIILRAQHSKQTEQKRNRRGSGTEGTAKYSRFVTSIEGSIMPNFCLHTRSNNCKRVKC